MKWSWIIKGAILFFAIIAIDYACRTSSGLSRHLLFFVGWCGCLVVSTSFKS